MATVRFMAVGRLVPPETGLVATYFAASAPSRVGVVVIGGSEGGMKMSGFQAALLADAGYPAVAVAYHGEEGLPSTLSAVPLELFTVAAEWLSVADSLDRVVLAGASRGSEAALLAAAHLDCAAAVVGLVPGNVVLTSWPPGKPAWTLRGDPLPFTGWFGPRCSDPTAVIPVERIRGPLFLVGAGRDDVWPSAAMVEAIAARRHDHGRTDDVVLNYPDATHAVGLLAPRSAPTLELDRDARADAWHHLIAFLEGLP